MTVKNQKLALRELEAVFSSDIFPRTIALTMVSFDRVKRGRATPEEFFANGVRGLLLSACVEAGLDQETAIRWTAAVADQSVKLAMEMATAFDLEDNR